MADTPFYARPIFQGASLAGLTLALVLHVFTGLRDQVLANDNRLDAHDVTDARLNEQQKYIIEGLNDLRRERRIDVPPTPMPQATPEGD